jgi:hypothetical protein
MLDQPSPTGTSGSDELDLELQDIAQGKTTETPAAQVTAIPDKYKDKSLEDVIAMHQNAEKLISRQGNDMAQLKQSAHVLATQNRTNVNQERKQTPTTVEALLDNPDKTIEEAVAASPAVRQAQASAERVSALEAKLAYGDFVRKHPKYQEDIADDTFLDWVKKNPVRLTLSQRADALDFNSADALWDMWSEHKDLVSSPADRSNKVRQVSTVKGVPSGSKGKPVYSRSKLDELRSKAHDGDQNAQAKLADRDFNERLVEAYAEGRVR